MQASEISGYEWKSGALTSAHDYLLPVVLSEVARVFEALPAGERRLFEVGCGNGSVASVLTQHGWDVTGIDRSTDGIAHANANHPSLKLRLGSAYDDLSTHYGRFPVVVSLEVAEHV